MKRRPLNLISIDPGYAKKGDGCAVSYYQGGHLVRAWFERPNASRLTLARFPNEPKRIDAVVWEKAQADGRTYSIPVDVVIELTAVGGVLAGLYAGRYGAGECRGIPPSEWNRNQHKPKTHAALWDELDARERAILGGRDTRLAIDVALDLGASTRWARRRGGWYPESFVTHNLLDSSALGMSVILER